MSIDDRRDDDFARNEFGDERGYRDAPPKRGMSTAVKVILFLLVGGGLLAILCCGGVFFFVKRNVSVQTDPAEIRATLAEIASIEIPESFEPAQGMKMTMGIQMRLAAFKSTSGGTLVLMEMTLPAAQGDQEAQMRQQMSQQNVGGKDLTIIESNTREFDIKGQKSTFTFAKAKDAQSTEFRQVSGTFPGNTGTAMLMLQVPEKDYNEEQVVKMIESIR